MKPIDAEPIIKNLSAMQTQLGYDAIDIDGMIKALKEADEIKIDGFVHGRWVFDHMTGERSYWAHCSACGFTTFFKSEEDETPYCQTCGAKMDEEETK